MKQKLGLDERIVYISEKEMLKKSHELPPFLGGRSSGKNAFHFAMKLKEMTNEKVEKEG